MRDPMTLDTTLNAHGIRPWLHASRPSDCGLQVSDIGAVRPDLTQRQELKFAPAHRDVGTLRSLLEMNGRRAVYHRPIAVVRSVYFDDPRFSACNANLEGLARRRKLRLRWYDRPLPLNEAYLEIKWRDNRVTGKHRLRIVADEAFWQRPLVEIHARLLAVVPGYFRPVMLQYSEPTVLVEYQREHFVSPDRKLRATLDYGAVYYQQCGLRRISTRFGRRHEGFVIVEGKAPVGEVEALRPFLAPLVRRPIRCSKYVYGCQMLELVCPT